jgi:hypothetical protein
MSAPALIVVSSQAALSRGAYSQLMSPKHAQHQPQAAMSGINSFFQVPKYWTRTIPSIAGKSDCQTQYPEMHPLLLAGPTGLPRVGGCAIMLHSEKDGCR